MFIVPSGCFRLHVALSPYDCRLCSDSDQRLISVSGGGGGTGEVNRQDQGSSRSVGVLSVACELGGLCVLGSCVYGSCGEGCCLHA